MPDEIKRLQNELVSIYQADRDCGATFEDSEIIAAYEAAIEALKSKPKAKKHKHRTPMKIKAQGFMVGTYWFNCPKCGEPWWGLSRKAKYCPACGQALDWSEVKE